VRAVSESQLMMACAADVEAVRVGEDLRITVGRTNTERHEGARFQRDRRLGLTKDHGLQQEPVVELQRAFVAQAFLDRRCKELVLAAQHRPLLPMLQKRHKTVGDQVGRGLMPSVEQEDALMDKLGLTQALAVHLALDQA